MGTADRLSDCRVVRMVDRFTVRWVVVLPSTMSLVSTDVVVSMDNIESESETVSSPAPPKPP